VAKVGDICSVGGLPQWQLSFWNGCHLQGETLQRVIPFTYKTTKMKDLAYSSQKLNGNAGGEGLVYGFSPPFR